MTLLPVLMLAAGLNTAASPTLPASHGRQAEATMNRLVSATEPTLHQRSIDRALAEGAHGVRLSLANEIVASAPGTRLAERSPAVTHRQAKVRMDRLVNEAQAKLAPRAIDKALTEGLHVYKNALADEIAHSAAIYGVALRTAAKSAAESALLFVQ